jgi:asparagine synthase (glutamine-hydrolysing)
MAVFAFALALEPGRPLALRGPLSAGLNAPSTLRERSGEGWHAVWRNAASGPQSDFAIGDDGTVAIVTARLEQRDALRARLGADRSEGDAALLLRAYGKWGESFLDHVRGEFAFVVWNRRRRRLIAARDQIGASPLFHRDLDGVLLVGTAFDAIRDQDRDGLSLSDVFIGDLLLHGTSSQHDASIYNEIHRVPAAHALHVTGQRREIRRYWSFPPYRDPLILGSRGEYGEAFYATMREAVAERLPDSGPIVMLMSGGLDSTAIAAAAADILGRDAARERLKAYTTVFRQDGEQEGAYAAMVASRLGIEHRQIVADDHLSAPYERPDWVPREPALIPSLLPEARASAAAEQGGGVLLTGLGPDVYLRAPGTGFRHIAARGFGAVPDIARYVGTFGKMPAFGIRASLGRLRRHLAENPATHAPILPVWIDPDFVARSGLIDRLAARRSENVRRRAEMLTSPFWPTILSWGHPAMSGRALLPANPFLSLQVIELVVRLPLHAVLDKAVLRWAMRGRLPDAVVERPKTPLGPAVANLSRGDPAILARRRGLIEAQAAALSRYVNPDLAIARLDSDVPADGLPVAMLEVLAYWFQASENAKSIV